jgi:hypothetical protein
VVSKLGLSAVVPFKGQVDPGAATVTIDRLAHELGGAQELLRDRNGESFLPAVLKARHVARWGRAVFESAPGRHPKVRLALQRLPGDRLKVDLRVRGLTIPEAPELCDGDPMTTTLMTRLAAIDDGTNPPLEVPIQGIWQCLADRDGDLHRLHARNRPFHG